ncbi:hypothetical protein [Brevundimonas abyssalis]|uniref:Uncharacterized protein n=1 Tax=Brevundimonas abyssalis TAR-001 TaxID=1391729 RepID=A0A8E0NC92_9CAUL|nr:hypothetical protein [Brevundimonas abyssalis]GAD59712.1 hypothetical protein MBEBAB_1962 [Brevundimonas abyssalis TAR-001]
MLDQRIGVRQPVIIRGQQHEVLRQPLAQGQEGVERVGHHGQPQAVALFDLESIVVVVAGIPRSHAVVLGQAPAHGRADHDAARHRRRAAIDQLQRIEAPSGSPQRLGPDNVVAGLRDGEVETRVQPLAQTVVVIGKGDELALGRPDLQIAVEVARAHDDLHPLAFLSLEPIGVEAAVRGAPDAVVADLALDRSSEDQRHGFRIRLNLADAQGVGARARAAERPGAKLIDAGLLKGVDQARVQALAPVVVRGDGLEAAGARTTQLEVGVEVLRLHGEHHPLPGLRREGVTHIAGAVVIHGRGFIEEPRNLVAQRQRRRRHGLGAVAQRQDVGALAIGGQGGGADDVVAGLGRREQDARVQPVVAVVIGRQFLEGDARTAPHIQNRVESVAVQPDLDAFVSPRPEDIDVIQFVIGQFRVLAPRQRALHISARPDARGSRLDRSRSPLGQTHLIGARGLGAETAHPDPIGPGRFRREAQQGVRIAAAVVIAGQRSRVRVLPLAIDRDVGVEVIRRHTDLQPLGRRGADQVIVIQMGFLGPRSDLTVGVTLLEHAADRPVRHQPRGLLCDGRGSHDQGQGACTGEAGADGRHERIPP